MGLAGRPLAGGPPMPLPVVCLTLAENFVAAPGPPRSTSPRPQPPARLPSSSSPSKTCPSTTSWPGVPHAHTHLLLHRQTQAHTHMLVHIHINTKMSDMHMLARTQTYLHTCTHVCKHTTSHMSAETDESSRPQTHRPSREGIKGIPPTLTRTGVGDWCGPGAGAVPGVRTEHPAPRHPHAERGAAAVQPGAAGRCSTVCSQGTGDLAAPGCGGPSSASLSGGISRAEKFCAHDQPKIG